MRRKAKLPGKNSGAKGMRHLRWLLLVTPMIFGLSGCETLKVLPTCFYREKPFSSLRLSSKLNVYEIEFTPRMWDTYDLEIMPDDPSTLGLDEHGYYQYNVSLKMSAKFWQGSQYLGECAVHGPYGRSVSSSRDSSYIPLVDVGTVKTILQLNVKWIDVQPPWEKSFLQIGKTYKAVITIEGLDQFLKDFGPTVLILRPEPFQWSM